MANGWLGVFAAYFVLLSALVAFGVFFDQTLILFTAAILLAGLGAIIGCAMAKSSRDVKRMQREEGSKSEPVAEKMIPRTEETVPTPETA
jgi:Mn2+/Fe2+ NRAMP family transporter